MDDALNTKAAGILANAALLLASLLVGLLLCEVGLRLLHPKYAYLAEAPFIRDPNLLMTRIPGNRSFFRHPDTGARHPLFHNNLGLRQSRDFSAEDLENSVNIGFFGDSFTENAGLKAQFSFTEPLDYLLNIGAGEDSVNVLNFGVRGYGMAQSLLRYEMLDFREALDHVFYVYCENDPGDDLANGLFRIDDAGQLARGTAPSPRFSLLSRLHLPYLVLDAGGRLSQHLEQLSVKADGLKHQFNQRLAGFKVNGFPRSDSLPLFRQLLRRWKAAAQRNGSSFRLVWLPMEHHNSPGVAAIVEEEGVETLSLRDCFGERDPAHLRMPWELSPYRFESDDWHWNEAGNRLAAVCLHRVLESDLGLPQLSEEDVELAMRHYYSAFEAPASALGGRGGSRMKTEGRLASPPAEAIRRKYAALERRLEARVSSPDEWTFRARFDVQLRDGWLTYVREGCSWADYQDSFFLHVIPEDVQDIPVHRRKHGFENLDFWASINEDNLDVLAGVNETTCTIRRKLPNYAIDRIRTGQFYKNSDGDFKNLWYVETAGPS